MTTTPGLRVALYTRVSDISQGESGLGLAAQLETCRKYADLYHLEIVKELVDVASGKNLDRRGIQEAIGMLASGKADGILVAKLDRLTRRTIDLGMLLEGPLAPGKGALVVVGEQIDTTTAAGRMMAGILVTIAAWERETISERTTAALAAKKRMGMRVGGLPYGYKTGNGGMLTENPAEQRAIRLMRGLREEGFTVEEIIDALDEEGCKPRGKAWHAQTIGKLLKDCKRGAPIA